MTRANKSKLTVNAMEEMYTVNISTRSRTCAGDKSMDMNLYQFTPVTIDKMLKESCSSQRNTGLNAIDWFFDALAFLHIDDRKYMLKLLGTCEFCFLSTSCTVIDVVKDMAKLLHLTSLDLLVM